MKEDALIVGGIALAILGVLYYLKHVVGNAIDDTVEAVKHGAQAVGDAAVSGAGTAVGNGVLNPAGSIDTLQQENGLTPEEATILTTLGMGGMGA